MFLNDIKVGQIISFTYTGGSHPGPRTVEVTDRSQGSIKGHDIGLRYKNPNDCFRHFVDHRIVASTLRLVAHAHEEVIASDFVANPENVPPSSLVEVFKLLHPNRKGVRFDPVDGHIIARRDDFPRFEIVLDTKRIFINFYNEEGGKTGMELNVKDGETVPNTSFICQLTNEQMKNFVSGLVRLYSGGAATKNDWENILFGRIAGK